MKETNFKRCYINGKRAGVASYDNGEHRILYFSETMGKGIGVEDLKNAGVSLHQLNNSLKIDSADLSGIQAAIPGAVVDWAGSKEYNARAAAAVGTRSGGASSATPKESPAVASSDAFQIPPLSECQPLGNLLNMMAPALTDSVKEWAADLAAAFVGGKETPDLPETIQQAAAFAPALTSAVDAYREIIRRAVDEYKSRIEAEAAARAAAEKAAQAAAAAAANGKQLVTLPDGSTVEVTGKSHTEFATVCQLVKRGRNVYLYGPAGTGKTYLCKQIAEALNLDFYSDQKISNDFQLTGFVDASGKFQETELYRAFTRGGVYMLDEFDASDECAATVLNTALANGYMTFPGVGRVEMHPDFHVIACGNTIGRGADSDYTGRNCLDAATLDRFVIRAVGYDPEIELAKANGDKELVNFIHAVRDAIVKCGVSLVASMRAIENIAAVADCFPPEECLKMGLLKGLETDQVAQIANECKGRGKWIEALKALAA